MEVKEFEIPVSWGHIAVKAWGNERNAPVLMLHGLGDNAGSFDRILPLLSPGFYYICIDLPGHGKSSHFPPYLFITTLDILFTLKIILDYLGRKKYILMGHSWGAQASILFTQMYPEYTLKLIMLDSFYYMPNELATFKSYLTDRINSLIQTNESVKSKKQPSYLYEEAVTKLMDNRYYGELSREAAEVLIKRSIVSTENGKVRFTNDPRLRFPVAMLGDMKFIVGLMKKYPLKCPVLVVIASDSEILFNYFKDLKNQMLKNRNCIIKKVRGSHDVHNNSPEIVAPIVNKFLLKESSKL